MFSFGKKSGPVLGLDINSSTISVIQLEKTKTDTKVSRFSSMPTPPDVVREGLLGDPEAVGGAVRELLDLVGIPKKKPLPTVYIGIPGQAVVIRLMPVPSGMPDDELADVIRQEAINNLPFPVDEANLDHAILPATERTDPDGVRRVDVILAAIQHIVVDSYRRMAEVAEVELGKLDISSLAVIRALSFAGLLQDDNTLTMTVNIRHDATDITLVKRGMPLFSRSVLLGVETLGEAISRSIDAPVDEAISLLPKLQLGAVPTSDPRLGQAAQVARSVFGDLTAEVGRSLEFYMSQVGSVQVDQVILSGAGCMAPGIHDFMANRLNIRATVADPFQNVIYDKAQILDEYRANHTMLLGLVLGAGQAPLKTVELDLNSGVQATVTGEGGEEGDEEVEEVDTPWFIPALGVGLLLVLAAAGVWAFATYYVSSNADTELANLENEISQQKQQISAMGKDQEEVTALRQKKDVLERIVKHGTPRAALLQTVRDNIPQGMQITNLTMNDSKLNIIGTTVDFAKVSHYAINLGSSQILENPHLKEAHRVVKYPEQIAFTIDANIRPEAQMAQLDQSKMGGSADAAQSLAKPQLLYFYVADFPACQKFRPTIDAVKKQFGDKIEIQMIDVNDNNNKDLVNKYSAKQVPDTYVIDGKGQVADHFQGPVPAQSIDTAIETVLKAPAAPGTKS